MEQYAAVKGGMTTEVRRLKGESGRDLVILGSGSIVSQLTQDGLIDEYQIVLNAVVLGKGRTMFDGVKKQAALSWQERDLPQRKILLSYERVV